MRNYLILALLLVALAGLALYTLRPAAQAPPSATSVAEAMGGDSLEGYARAYTPRPFHFPEDHGPHPEFRTEWWYVTGNLVDAQGRCFGYQLTLFRIALSPNLPESDSAWRTDQIYMGHFPSPMWPTTATMALSVLAAPLWAWPGQRPFPFGSG